MCDGQVMSPFFPKKTGPDCYRGSFTAKKNVYGQLQGAIMFEIVVYVFRECHGQSS